LATGDELVIKGPWNLPVTYAAKITVKRVFRGERDRFKAGSVVIEGFGNPKICVSRPKIGDTRNHTIQNTPFSSQLTNGSNKLDQGILQGEVSLYH
jgi:hypothetical protein